MKNTTTHKPVKHSAGVYTYRGVKIKKHNRLGFTFITYCQGGGWYYGSIGTLTAATTEVDKALESGNFVLIGASLQQMTI